MIEINNLSGFRIDKKLFTGVAKKVLKGENKGIKNISLAFVTKEEIKKLNKKHRGKNKPTDVLAFGEISNFKFQISNYLGEVVICPEIAKGEMLRVFVHGILHLLGYDHKTERQAEKMQKAEEKYISRI